MTIPCLMNCSHSREGWCIDCVSKLQAESNEAILQDLVECLRDQIDELTLRLDNSERLCGAYRSTLLRQPTADEVCSVMADLKISGCMLTQDGWDNLDCHTKELFLDDLVAIATI